MRVRAAVQLVCCQGVLAAREAGFLKMVMDTSAWETREVENSYEGEEKQQRDSATDEGKGYKAPSLSLRVMVVVKVGPLPVVRHSFHYNPLHIHLQGDHTSV